MARRVTSQPAPAWVGDLPVFERTLDNGLKALVLPRKHAPVVVCDLYFPVGAVDEPPGKSGLAHFVEHMLFKGTRRFPKGYVDRLTFLAGGRANAETGEDLTHYWLAFPADRWELSLFIGSDWVRGALFDPREVEAERHVIMEERALDQDSVVGRLDQQLLAHAYLHSPYRNPILGWPDELARLSVEDLRAFYDLHYRPDGAVIVVVGDVTPEAALDRIEHHFGKLAASPNPRPEAVIVEPRQTGKRTFTLHEPLNVQRGQFAWHVVPRGHPDSPILDVIADLLTCGRRSRLWAALVDAGQLATGVDSWQERTRHGGQFLINVECPIGVAVDEVESVMRQVIDTLGAEGPTGEELARCRRRLEAAWRWEQEDLQGLAAGLGQYALMSDWRTWQAEYRAALTVSPQDIQRVIATYLADTGLTCGWALPREGPSPTTGPVAVAESRPPRPAAPPAEEPPLGIGIPALGSRLTSSPPRRTVLPNGIRLLTEPCPGTGIVALELYVDAGYLKETKPGLASLTGRMLEEGTTSRSSAELAELVEDVGGALEYSSTGLSLRMCSEDLPLAVEILADVILRPAFPGDALAWTRKRIASELQSDRDDPAFRAEQLFRGLVYGKHPCARDPRGSVRELGRLTLDDVREHHQRFYVPDTAILIAVGDFQQAALETLVTKHLGGWKPRGGRPPSIPRVTQPRRPHVRRVSHDSEQVHLVIGHLGIPRRHRQHDALVVLDHIFGTGPGFCDRLSRVVRDEMGLAYSIGGGVTDTADLAPGMFRVALGTMPEEVDRAVEAIREQIQAMHDGAFSDEEVDRARRYLAGSWVFDYQNVDQRAERLLELERFSMGPEELFNLPHRFTRITPRQVRSAARANLLPEALVRVELGPTHRRRGKLAVV